MHQCVVLSRVIGGGEHCDGDVCECSDVDGEVMHQLVEDLIAGDEVIEAAEILRPGKLLLRTLESSKFLNLALF